MPNTKNTSPFLKFEDWYNEAQSSELSYPDGFTLSTVSKEGAPSARTVLLKAYNENCFTFFTNYSSQKSLELFANSKVHMLFYWKSTQKQIRISGEASKSSKSVSDSYWASRPLDSRLHAVLSNQSSAIPEGYDYKQAFADLKTKHPNSVPRPDHWGGVDITPNRFEFWEEGEYRWHKREVCTLDSEKNWDVQVLFP